MVYKDMRWIALGIVAFVALMLMAGCGDSFTQSASGHGTNIADANSNNTSSGETPQIEANGSTPFLANNPYNCPEGTTIRSDCSVVSQQTCVCMLP